MVAVLASVSSNVEGGSYMTFGGPVGLFCVVGAILWLLLFRPHSRIPPRRALTASQASAGNVSGSVASQAVADQTEGAADEAQPQQDTTTNGMEASE